MDQIRDKICKLYLPIVEHYKKMGQKYNIYLQSDLETDTTSLCVRTRNHLLIDLNTEKLGRLNANRIAVHIDDDGSFLTNIQVNFESTDKRLDAWPKFLKLVRDYDLDIVAYDEKNTYQLSELDDINPDDLVSMEVYKDVVDFSNKSVNDIIYMINSFILLNDEYKESFPCGRHYQHC